MKPIPGKSLLLAGMFLGVVLLSCEKNELPPDSIESPVLMAQGTFKGIDYNWIVDGTRVEGSTWISDSNTGLFPHAFVFNFSGTGTLPVLPGLRFYFNNHSLTFGNLNNQIDSTFQPGTKEFTTVFMNPVNPYNLNAVSLELRDSTNTYSSMTMDSLMTYGCIIDSTKNIIWKDEKSYRLVYLHFNCMLAGLNSPFDLYPFTDVKAVLAFPRE
ncbi:MAG TPA: hypothetical protein P5531_01980 [Bacteroidales bacterium]|nr:hypothetical protein [Bacteroidales bacterium]HSA43062.1 hypothetical protein [Bacteroidales bacterium]